MLVRAKHPGWPRLLGAVAIGPLVAPIIVTFSLTSNNAVAVEEVIRYVQDPLAAGKVHEVTYPVTILFGLPIVLGLGRFELAGFIPVMIAGVVFGALAGALFSIFGAGRDMFVASVGVTAACWLIAFLWNPRARATQYPRR